MKTLETMTKDEKSLLLYLETCAVDCSGKVQAVRMNSDDQKIVERWNAEGFVSYGRIASEDLNEYGSHWCHLSDEAWALAAAERRARAERLWKQRRWRTTEEKRNAA